MTETALKSLSISSSLLGYFKKVVRMSCEAIEAQESLENIGDGAWLSTKIAQDAEILPNSFHHGPQIRDDTHCSLLIMCAATDKQV